MTILLHTTTTQWHRYEMLHCVDNQYAGRIHYIRLLTHMSCRWMRSTFTTNRSFSSSPSESSSWASHDVYQKNATFFRVLLSGTCSPTAHKWDGSISPFLDVFLDKIELANQTNLCYLRTICRNVFNGFYYSTITLSPIVVCIMYTLSYLPVLILLILLAGLQGIHIALKKLARTKYYAIISTFI